MSDAPIKTSILNGNLNRNSTLSNQICEYSSNISNGLWNICFPTFCFDAKDQTGIFASVTCNLVKDKRFNPETKQLETYNPVLASLFLKGRKIVYIEKTWFTINNQCSDVVLYFTNIQTNRKVTIDCEMFVTILFQRVK
jgi:hypothetical protein